MAERTSRTVGKERRRRVVEAAVFTHEPAAADADVRVLGEDLEKSLQHVGRDATCRG